MTAENSEDSKIY